MCVCERERESIHTHTHTRHTHTHTHTLSHPHPHPNPHPHPHPLSLTHTPPSPAHTHTYSTYWIRGSIVTVPVCRVCKPKVLRYHNYNNNAVMPLNSNNAVPLTQKRHKALCDMRPGWLNGKCTRSTEVHNKKRQKKKKRKCTRCTDVLGFKLEGLG